MAKQRSFADKIYKKKHVVPCPVCAENLQPVLYVTTETPSEGQMRFRRQIVQVCKCNRLQIYGTPLDATPTKK